MSNWYSQRLPSVNGFFYESPMTSIIGPGRPQAHHPHQQHILSSAPQPPAPPPPPPQITSPIAPTSALGSTAVTTAASSPGPKEPSSDHSTPSAPVRSRSRKKSDDNLSYPVNYPIHSLLPNYEIDETQRPLIPSEIKTVRYATGIDDRNFITVYEYSIGEQSIIWDYFTGYVHLTGIWKALGNSKADIVRLLDGSPELEQVFKRVRGGFLKIQGTWVPYDVAKALSVRFCYSIRYALVPIFGPDFPAKCLEPHDKGYCQLQTRPSAKPRRRSSQTRSTMADKPYTRKSSTASTQSAPLAHHKLWDPTGDGCAIDSTDDESDSGTPNSPPPMPRKLSMSLVDAQSVLASPPQFLEMLQATRSLQQLSAGSSWPTSSLGGDFEVEGSGKRYIWDGESRLERVFSE